MRGLGRQIRYDLKAGAATAWKKWVLLAVILVFFCLMFGKRAWSSEILPETMGNPGFFYYLTEIMKGMLPPSGMEDRDFHVSAVWLVMNGFLVLAAGWYPYKDFQVSGYQSLLRAGDKKKWWYGKCVWAAVITLIFYIVSAAVIFLFSVITGGGPGGLHPEMDLLLSGVDTSGLGRAELASLALALPYLASLSMILPQIAISLAAGPVMGVVFGISVLSASAYFVSPALPGNLTMLWRSSRILGERGADAVAGAVFSVFYCILAVWLGKRMIIRKDILKKESGM